MRRACWMMLIGCGLLACSGTDTLGAEKKGTEVTLGGLKSTTPADWESQKPSNKFRAYQFRVPKSQGDKADAELVIFYFGPGSGGNAADNVKRWQSMFEPPQGKTIGDATKVENKKVGKVDVTYADIHGTFKEKFPPFDPNAKVTLRPNYRRIGVVFACENGPYFITLTGPANTVAQHKKEFDRWLEGFK